jgi:integrase
MDLEQPGRVGISAPDGAGRDATSLSTRSRQIARARHGSSADAAPVLILAATTGARRGQLLALKWADVDFEHESLSFQRAWVEGPNGPVLAPTKTRRSHRVALDPYTQSLLEGEWKRVDWCSTRDLDDVFVFTSHPLGERPWNPNWVTKQFIRHRRAAGIDHFRLHDLRHFLATQMLGSGVAISVVSARLAHARASTTLNVYADAIPGADVQAAQLISRIVARQPGSLSLLPTHGREVGDGVETTEMLRGSG